MSGSRAIQFTLDAYLDILCRARAAGYRIARFCDDPRPTADVPVLLLRHDLDHDLDSALRMGELEAANGIASTYFVQVACPFYNLLAPSGRRALRELVAHGHEIGLHYEPHRYVGIDTAAELRRDLALLECLSGTRITAAAQHLPLAGGTLDLDGLVAHDAYAPRFIIDPFAYVSDSLMRWREQTPLDLLSDRRSFQFLAHPECWMGHGPTIDVVLDALAARSLAQTRSQFRATRHTYAKLLERREELDRRFKLARDLPTGPSRGATGTPPTAMPGAVPGQPA